MKRRGSGPLLLAFQARVQLVRRVSRHCDPFAAILHGRAHSPDNLEDVGALGSTRLPGLRMVRMHPSAEEKDSASMLAAGNLGILM